jgi:hypothetical protein
MMGKRHKKTPMRGAVRVPMADLRVILERTRASGVLTADQNDTLDAVVDTLAALTLELEAKTTSIDRLRRLIFGASTESASRVLGKRPRQGPGNDSSAADEPDGNTPTGTGSNETPKRKGKGHGRNGADNYTGAKKIGVPHGSLHVGDACPECEKGKVYRQAEPAVLVRVKGVAPLDATLYELERLRCNLCGEVYPADAPEGVGSEKYDAGAASMIALLKYGCGLPFHRLERLQGALGIPLPTATQWDVVERAARLLEPAYAEHVRQAAQGDVLYNDDTTGRILALARPTPPDSEPEDASNERTGIYTSGIVSTREGRRIALFFTGHQHAGENLADVLAKRAADLPPPIQMCDALSHNTAGDFQSILANCNAHGRRRFVDVVESFPDECRYVLEILQEVYKTDAVARRDTMSPDARLTLHQAESGPRMDDLEKWMRAQIEERKVEPNSGLGEAIGYMLKHWKALTLFLRVPGAPLDNNICERALKKAILHRKNALFYKTQNGARVGDLFMTLIHTAELESINPFDYLVALQRHHEAVAADPASWMPWSYRETLERLNSPKPTPG